MFFWGYGAVMKSELSNGVDGPASLDRVFTDVPWYGEKACPDTKLHEGEGFPRGNAWDRTKVRRDLWNPTSGAKSAPDMGHPGFVENESQKNASRSTLAPFHVSSLMGRLRRWLLIQSFRRERDLRFPGVMLGTWAPASAPDLNEVRRPRQSRESIDHRSPYI